MLIEPPPKLTGEKRLTFHDLDWQAFRQIQALLSERTRARFSYDNVDPPPDLVVEVDITNTDLNKNKLYAGLGIPEFWRFNGREWRIFLLEERAYVECDRSFTFPIVTKPDLYQFLETALQDEVTAEVNFRQWVKQQTS